MPRPWKPRASRPNSEERSAADWLAVLRKEGDREAREAIWKKVKEAGKMNEVIAALTKQAEEQPNNADVRLELGNAYLQQVFGAQGPEQGRYAMAADQAFDNALAIDPGHWEARLTKAISLSHWPAAFGKSGEAISQFETLLEQQSRMTPAPGHAHTYYYLGNLYLNTGQKDKAREIWQTGLKKFPQNSGLQKQLQHNR